MLGRVAVGEHVPPLREPTLDETCRHRLPVECCDDLALRRFKLHGGAVALVLHGDHRHLLNRMLGHEHLDRVESLVELNERDRQPPAVACTQRALALLHLDLHSTEREPTRLVVAGIGDAANSASELVARDAGQ